MTPTASVSPAPGAADGTPRSARVGAVPQGAVAQRPAVGNGTVLLYLGLALAALLPGLALAAGIELDAHGSIGAWLAALKTALADIRFGSGLRFWLGVAGASLMGLLLLYPLRKAFAQRFRLGGIAGWFHVHILIGLAGPVLILYHCNFGLGALNANVALWTMLAIAASGIAGHFVYARVSADYWSEKQVAREHLDAAVLRLRDLAAQHPGRSPTALIERIEDFEAATLRPRAGIWAGAAAMREAARQRREILAQVAVIVADCARAKGWTAAIARQCSIEARTPLDRYFRLAGSTARRSIGEQLWARWRLFHLPLFLVMTVAVILHIAAVWGMDGGAAPQTATPPAVEASLGSSRVAPSVGPTPQVSAAAQSQPDPRARLAVKSIQTQTIATIEMETPAPLVRRADPKPPPKAPDAIARLLGTAAAEQRSEGPSVSAGVGAAPEAASALKAVEAQAPAAPLARPVPKRAAPPAPVRTADATRKPEASAAAPTAPGFESKPAPLPPADIKSVYSELQRKTETAQMGLGAPKPKSLAEQIKELKARRFAHAEADTGFALTGKHTRIDCTECHSRPLLDAKPTDVRGCVACHRSDDVHRGRRPDCARCHTPNRWSEIIRRR